MPLTPGTRLGSFLIEAPLGAGGMDKVYVKQGGWAKKESIVVLVDVDSPM
jgi:hypothetical protein